VQNTVRAEAGTAEIYDATKDTSSGQPIYTIFFQNHDVFPPLYVTADGSVLHPDLSLAVRAPEITRTGVKLTELPPDALKVVHDRAPKSEITTISKDKWGDRMIYTISFKDETHHPKLYVSSDGILFNEVPK
jgi:hypothetical protein